MRTVVWGLVGSLIASTVGIGGTGPNPVDAAPVAPIETTAGPSGGDAALSERAGFTPVTPARLVDTRPSGTTVDHLQADAGRVGARSTLTVQIGGRGDVPAGARAAILNVTAVRPDARGFLTVYPTGVKRPNASNLNYAGGDIVASQVVVRLGTGGRAEIYTEVGTHVVVDVVGWIDDEGAGDVLVPARIVDSRPTGETVDDRLAGFGTIGAGRALSVDVLGRGGVPSSGVGAVVVSIIAVRPSERGYLTVYPHGENRPDASNLNYLGGDIVNREVVVKLGDSGRFDIFTFADTHMVVDVVAWLPEGSDLAAMSPTRLVDTRPGHATADGDDAGAGRLAAGVPMDITIGGRAGVPEQAGAVMLSVTAVNPSAAGFITVFPNGEELPDASAVNFPAGGVAGNQVMVRLGRHDTIRVYSSAETHLVVDLVAWMPPGTNQPLNNVQTLMEYQPKIAPLSGGPNTGGAVFEIPEGADVRVDDIVVFVTPDGLPYYGEVTAISGRRATTTEVTLGEVIPTGSFELLADAETGVIQSSDFAEQTADVIASRALTESLDVSATKEGDKYNASCSGGGDADVDVEYYVDALNFGASASWGFFSGLEAELYYKPTIGFEAEGIVTVAGKCTLEVPLKKKLLKPITFTIGPIPILITQEMKLALEVSLETESAMTITAGATVTAKVGVRYDDGFHAIREFGVRRSLAVNQQSAITMSVGLPFTYEAAFYGYVGGTATVTPSVAAKLMPGQTKWLTLTAQIDYALEAFIKISFGFFSIDKRFDLASGTAWGPKEIYSRSRTKNVVPLTANVPPKTAVGAPYEATFSIPYQGPGAAIAWRAQGLPAGLQLTRAANGLSAKVHGTPTTEGPVAFGIDIDVEPYLFSDNPSYATGSFNVDVKPRFVANTQVDGVGEVGRPFAGAVSATGGVAPYTWTATGLPSGVFLSAGTTNSPVVALIGNPGTDGAGTATITARDATGVTLTIPISWSVAKAVSITSTAFPTGGTGKPYTQTFTINGGVLPITHGISGMPYGLTSFRSGRTVTVTGTPQIANSYGVRLAVRTERGGTAAQIKYFDVRASMRFASPTVSLPVGDADMQPGDGWLTVLGGTPPYTWNVTGLPAGVTFDTNQNRSRVRFVGATENPMAVPVQVTVTDSSGAPTPAPDVTLRSSSSTTFDTTSLPGAAIGAAYATDVVVSGGRAPYRWSARGLPAGVELRAGTVDGTYRLVGTPTGPAGNYQVELTVGDNTTRPAAVGRFPLLVDTALALVDGTLPNGVVGTPYSSTGEISVSGGVAPYTWTVTGLPDGVELDANTTGAVRKLVGSPTAAGTSTVSISVTDAAGSVAASGTRTITVAPALSLSVGALPTKAYTYEDYTGSAASTGGNAPVTFAASGLPTGMTMASNGTVTGRPAVAGTSSVTVTATDAAGYTKQATVSLRSITPIVPDLTNAPTGLATGELYTGSVSATGGVPPYTYTVRNTAGGLPGFVDLDPTTGVFGTATPASEAATYPLEVTVADADGRSATATYSLAVDETPPINVATGGVPTTATVGTAYSGSVSASGGLPPYTWSLVDAPSWMSIDPSSGAVSGTPDTGDGPITVTFRATSGIFTGERAVTIDVRPAITIDTSLLPVSGAAGTAYSGSVSWAGGRNTTVTVTGLPATLTSSVSGSTMTITGRPLLGGTHNLRFSATDADGRTKTADVTLTIAAAPTLAIDTTAMPPSASLTTPGATYSGSATVNGGVTPYTWTVSGQPAGVTPTISGNTVSFSGRPAASGTFDIVLTVNDAAGGTDSKTVRVTITVVNMTVDVSDLWAVGHVGITESLGTVTAAGGTGTITYSATNLPLGLSIDPSTGVVSGTASRVESKVVTITATDSSTPTPNTASATWTVQIRTAIPITAPSLPTEFATTIFVPVLLPGYTGPAPTITSSAKLPDGSTSTTLFDCSKTYGGDYGCYAEPTVAGLTVDIFVSSSSGHGAWRGVLELSNQVKTDVSLGLDYGCAVYADTTMRCWGSNAAGQLGNSVTPVGGTAYDPQPVTDASGVEMTGWVDVEANANADAGEAFTCAIRNGTGSTVPTGSWGEVWCWGAGTQGQLGNNATAASPTPVHVNQEDRTRPVTAVSPATGTVAPEKLNGVSTLAVGGRQACARTTAASNIWFSTSLMCWGEDAFGTTRTYARPAAAHDIPTTSGTGSFTHTALPAIGRRHACYTGGNIACDGPDDLVAEGNHPAEAGHQIKPAGQSSGSAGQVASATKWVDGFPQDFDHRYLFGVTAGHSHSCAIYDDYVRNEVLCWGDNDQRQIGSTSTSNYTLSQWPAVGRTIGDNGVDPSVGAYDEYQTRFAFSGPSGNYSKIAAGGDVTCGIRTSAPAGIACWGVPYVAADAPNTAALITSDTTWAGLTVGPNAACAWKSTGQMQCWGANGQGQLGLGNTTLSSGNAFGEHAPYPSNV